MKHFLDPSRLPPPSAREEHKVLKLLVKLAGPRIADFNPGRKHFDQNLTDEMSSRISIMFATGVRSVSSRVFAPKGLNCLVTGRKNLIATDSHSFADVLFRFMSYFVLLSLCTGLLLVEIVSSRFLFQRSVD